MWPKITQIVNDGGGVGTQESGSGICALSHYPVLSKVLSRKLPSIVKATLEMKNYYYYKLCYSRERII